MSEGATTRVLFIGGYGRNGSTLLDRMLGQINGFVSIGEMRFLWEWGARENQLCGCGQPFQRCPFWCSVMEEAFGSARSIDIHEVVRLKRSVESIISIPGLVFPQLMSRHFTLRLKEYSRLLAQLYRAIAKISGADIIVDSSKHPTRGFLLSAMSSIELHTVHLVRDSRAVAFSWQRKRVRPEIHWKTAYMPIHGTQQVIREWVALNSLTAKLKWRSQRYVLVQYETLVTNPRRTMLRIVGGLSADQTELRFVAGNKVTLKQDHTVAGNPMRFTRGALDVRLDDEWRTQMPPGSKLLVTAATWPQLLCYGYHLR